MSGERQSNNPPLKKVIDDGAGENPFTLADRFLKSKKARNTSIYAAAIFSGLVPGAAAASNTAIVEQGEMPSQNALEGVMAGVLTEEVDLSQYKTLEVGYKGEEVIKLKQRMVELGYFKNESSVNNTFTASTPDYIKKFQEVNGLEPDGVADPEMQALFFSDKARKANGELIVSEPYLSKEILLGSEEEKIIDARFKNFLNGEGEFSDEKLKDIMFYSYIKGDIDLGLCGVTKNMEALIVQGVLLGHFGFEDNNFLAMGVKNNENKKEIVLVEWLMDEMIDVYSFVPVLNLENGKTFQKFSMDIFSKKSDLISFLDVKLLNNVVLFHFYNFDSNILNEKYDNEKIPEYLSKQVIPKRDININLVSELFVNLDSRRFDLGEARLKEPFVNDQNDSVTSLNDIRNKLANNSDDFSLIATIQYRISD